MRSPCRSLSCTGHAGPELAIRLDRFDPGRMDASGIRVPTLLLADDIAVPTFAASPSPVVHTSAFHEGACDTIHAACCTAATVVPSAMVSLTATVDHCLETGSINVDWLAILPSTRILATPVSELPILRTALARQLATLPTIPQGGALHPMTGFLSLDMTRKAVLLCEDDPQVATRPLVGLWGAFASDVNDPLVWAACLRFMHHNGIGQRVLVPATAFLLCMFPRTDEQPRFYECSVVTDRAETLPFAHFDGSVVVASADKATIQSLRLTPATSGPTHVAFLRGLGVADAHPPALVAAVRAPATEAVTTSATPARLAQVDVDPSAVSAFQLLDAEAHLTRALRATHWGWMPPSDARATAHGGLSDT